MAADLIDLFQQFRGEDVTTETIECAIGTFMLAYGQDVIGIRQFAAVDDPAYRRNHGVIMGDTADMKRLARAILDVPDFRPSFDNGVVEA